MKTQHNESLLPHRLHKIEQYFSVSETKLNNTVQLRPLEVQIIKGEKN